jgi:hypothetical protein
LRDLGIDGRKVLRDFKETGMRAWN